MSDIDTNSLTWKTLAKAIQEQIAKNLTEIDTPQTSERRSDELRGANAALRDLLKLPNPQAPQPAIATDSSGYPI